jgi:hypothetical protein
MIVKMDAFGGKAAKSIHFYVFLPKIGRERGREDEKGLVTLFVCKIGVLEGSLSNFEKGKSRLF